MSANQELKAYIDGSQWHHVINLIRTNPSLCRKRYNVLFVTEGNEFSDVLPIQHACSKLDVPLEVLQTMVPSYPGSLLEKDSNLKRTCLHIAILKCLPDAILSYLIDMNPSATKIQDRHGRVPLHYACSTLRSFDILKQLIMPFPQCIQAPDWKQWTPLHVAVTKNTHPDIIEFMVNLRPETVLFRTKSGATPLELLMDAESSSSGTLSGVERDIHVKISRILLAKIDELNDRPESRNMMDAVQRPMTPMQMSSYGFV